MGKDTEPNTGRKYTYQEIVREFYNGVDLTDPAVIEKITEANDLGPIDLDKLLQQIKAT